MRRISVLLALVFSVLLIMTACQSANHNQAESAINTSDAIPVSKANLAGSEWRLVDLAGEKTVAVEQTLRFSADNKVTGKGGCNSYFGRYDVLDGELSIGPIGATKKLCERSIMRYEERFFAALRTALNAERVGDEELLIYCRDLAAPLRFLRLSDAAR